jgi:hypothetical protein
MLLGWCVCLCVALHVVSQCGQRTQNDLCGYVMMLKTMVKVMDTKVRCERH